MIEGRDFAAAGTVGARARQEDDWGTHVNPPAREAGAQLLAAVADGMGGMPAGDRASVIALRAFLDSYRAVDLPAAERLRHALAHANREVGIAVEADAALAGMGCTLVAALFFPDRCEWLSVGDSLILHWREGALNRINPLHVYASELDEMVRRGELSEDAARNDPERAALTSAIQGTLLEEVAQGVLPLAAGDMVLLASDGVLTLPYDAIESICAELGGQGAQRVAQEIVDRIDARGKPGQDNATLVAVCHASGADDERIETAATPDGSTAVLEEPGEARAAAGETADAAVREDVSDKRAASNGPPLGVVVETDPRALDARTAKNLEDGRVEQGASGNPPARAPAPGVRLLWLGAAFVLGAVCGVVGWQVLVSA